MMPPFSSRQAQTFSMKFFARPRSRRVLLLLAELALDHGLGGNAGMVGAREPRQRIRALPGARWPDQRCPAGVLLRTWPMVSTPATLGGGMAMV